MKSKRLQPVHYVVENLIKIMMERKLTKVAFADLIGLPEAKWNKISNGRQSLGVDDLSKIAKNLQMRDVDILLYPRVCIEAENTKKEEVKAQITVELKEELKAKVLNLVFGNKNLEILNN